jgi:uncharacterized protein (TIGR02453 family)
MDGKAYFTPETMQFLRDLRANNNREWFQANKERYENHVRQPFMHFISDFAPRLEKISKHIRADPRPQGGSLFRIYRDVRFSKNKDPYKTHAGAQFRHIAGKDVHAPGFYLHIAPDEVMAAAGVWKPDSATLRKIRDAIINQPERWKSIKSDPEFEAMFNLGGESLKRNPQGYDPEHELIEDLKRKDIFAFTEFGEEDPFQPNFLDQFVQVCETAAPFMKFLCDAIDQPF